MKEETQNDHDKEICENEILETLFTYLYEDLSDDKFRIIACRFYVYSLDSKSYDEQGSGDVATYFFYDQNTVYEWVRNFTFGVASIATYSRK